MTYPYIYRRDPAFARTLRTELDVGWTRRTLEKLREKYSFELYSLGEDTFMDRCRNIDFSTWAGLTKVRDLLTIMKKNEA